MMLITIGCLVVAALPIIAFALIIYHSFDAPPLPKITYGEFPYRLEYEIDNKCYIVEDVLIAEFDRSIRGQCAAPKDWSNFKVRLSHD